MSKSIAALVSASALLVAGTASAELPEWTYASLGFTQSDSQGVTADAVGLDLSVGFLDVWHVQAAYFDGQSGLNSGNESSSQSIDFDGFEVVVGAHPSITDSTQLVINARYFDGSTKSNSDIDYTGVSFDGFGFGIGFRSMVTDKVEAGLLVNWDDISSNTGLANEKVVSLGLTGRYYWTEAFSTGAEASIESDANSLGVNIRYNFAGF